MSTLLKRFRFNLSLLVWHFHDWRRYTFTRSTKTKG